MPQLPPESSPLKGFVFLTCLGLGVSEVHLLSKGEVPGGKGGRCALTLRSCLVACVCNGIWEPALIGDLPRQQLVLLGGGRLGARGGVSLGMARRGDVLGSDAEMASACSELLTTIHQLY